MPRIPNSASVSKRATNLSLSTDLLEAAKLYDVNVSQVCDSHLRQVINEERARRWRAENAAYIEKYNQMIESEGLPLDEWKNF